MALRDCPGCGKMISDKAERCPHCGVDPRKARENVAPEQKPVEATTAYSPKGANNGRGGKKKLWLILVPLILIGIGVAIWVPVYQHKKAEEQARIEQMRQDSIAAVEAELARIEQLRQDSIWMNFTSPDLTFFELKGHVKSVEGDISDIGEHPTLKNKIEFDENGGAKITTKGSINTEDCGKETWSIKRDANGKISNISYHNLEGLMCGTPSVSYIWNDGKIVKKKLRGLLEVGNDNLSYNENGDLEQRIGSGYAADVTWDWKNRYTDYVFDENGNWISRKRDSKTDSKTQKRVITYYDRQ
ncbi:MAG: zinc ribbon domain-containing protein [Paramuribaculum sp.]|nr:zinc ribbon domain-containing protein [Paramuribaculum sp.]